MEIGNENVWSATRLQAKSVSPFYRKAQSMHILKPTPPAKLAGNPISDDETVTKMEHPDLDVGSPADETS